MATEIEPPELARLLDFAERPRVQDWSLRAALTRDAQSRPQRVGALLELVRRIEFAVRPHLKAIEREGATHWNALQSGDGDDSVDPFALGLLQAMVELDRVGDEVARWAADPRAIEYPDAAVDAAITDVARRLEALGVPREQRPGPSRQRR